MLKNTFNKLCKAWVNSLDGFRVLWLKEQSFRLEVYSFLIILLVLCFLPLSGFLKLLLIQLGLFIILIEIINSAIETVIDRISTEVHILSKIAKDLGSSAVAVALIMNGIAWIYALGTLLIP